MFIANTNAVGTPIYSVNEFFYFFCLLTYVSFNLLIFDSKHKEFAECTVEQLRDGNFYYCSSINNYII